MNNMIQNGQISVATSALKFKYSDGNHGLFNSWSDMIDFWAPYYDSKADADRHLRLKAYGVAVSKDTEIMAAPVSGPLSTEQKADLINRASAYIA